MTVDPGGVNTATLEWFGCATFRLTVTNTIIFLDAYIDLKMQEVIRFEHTPHPVEFDMYYSA